MANIYNMTDTWTDGSTLTSIKMNVTDTSSAADSKLLDLQVGGSSKLTVGKDGAITAVQASSVIPFYYDSQGLFPSASTYHGAVAHSHNDGAMYFAHGGNWLKLVNADNSGNVGIGTASPTGGKLQIETTNEPGLFVKDTGNTAAPYVRVQGRRGDANRFSSFSGGLVLEAYRSDDKIRHAGKHLGTIYFGGNHTNGTEANISYAASISGVADGAFNSVTDMPTAIAFHTGSSGTALKTANTTFGTERMRISSDGEVQIAGTSDRGTYNLQVNGTGVWGQGAYTNGSDERMKEEIADLNGGLEVVNQLRPVTYRYREEFSEDSNTQAGFIAQELKQALSGKNYAEGTVPEGPEYLSVAYQNLIPVLTAAIQEQQTQIEALEARIAALESA